MKLLEVIRAVASSDEALQAGVEWGKSLDKLTVETKDKAGFIVNRLLVPYMLDAIRAYEEGVGTITEIDEAMKAGAGHPMGPLDARRLRRARHDGRDLRRAVRRVPRAAVRAPAHP